MKAAVVAVAAFAASCAHNVPQDLATGDDGKAKQAKLIQLEDNAAEIRGIVTYPGGDRIDWRKVELPTRKDGTPAMGTLSFTLTWKPPRPGLAVGMDVFDQYGRQVASEKGKQAAKKYRREADIAHATGYYLVRVYAPYRGDAGKYRLAVSFDEDQGGGGGFPPAASDIPDPPHLPAVPEPVAPTTPVVCDMSNWRQTKGCEDFCPIVPDKEMPGCQKTMPCDPNDWDSRIRKCRKVKGPVCPDGVVSTTCEPPPPAGPETGRVANMSQVGTKVEVRFNVRRNHTIEKGWKGYLVDKNKKKVPQSDFVVSKTAERAVWGQIDLTTDLIDGKGAVISPP